MTKISYCFLTIASRAFTRYGNVLVDASTAAARRHAPIVENILSSYENLYVWTASVWLRANHNNGAYYSQRLRVFCYFVYKCFFCWLNVTKTCGTRYSLFILSGYPLIRDNYHIYNWLYHVNFNSHLRHEHESIHFPPMKTDWTMWFTFVQFFAMKFKFPLHLNSKPTRHVIQTGLHLSI